MENKFPATKIIHWATGPVPCCDEHAEQLAGLAGFLGTHVAATEASHGDQCSNCINESELEGS